MAFLGGKSSNETRQRRARASRVPLNYYRSGRSSAPEKSPFLRKKPRNSKARKFIVRGIDIVVIFVVLGLIVYSLIVIPAPKVTLNSTIYHSKDIYYKAVANELSSIKNRNKVTLDETGLIKSLQKQFPEIAAGSVELPLFSETPIIHLTIAKPSFLLSSQSINYVIDSQGIAATTIRGLPAAEKLVLLDDQSGFTVKLGKPVLSSPDVAFIDSVVAQLSRAKVSISAIVLPTQAQEIDLRTPDHSYYVKFYLGGDPLLQTGQFLAARAHFDQAGQQPPSYLDVRVSGKIYYK